MIRTFRFFVNGNHSQRSVFFWGLGSVLVLLLCLGAGFFTLRFVFSRSLFLGFLVLFLIFPVIGRFFIFLLLAWLPVFIARFFRADQPSSKESTDRSAIDVPYRIVD